MRDLKKKRREAKTRQNQCLATVDYLKNCIEQETRSLEYKIKELNEKILRYSAEAEKAREAHRVLDKKIKTEGA